MESIYQKKFVSVKYAWIIYCSMPYLKPVKMCLFSTELEILLWFQNLLTLFLKLFIFLAVLAVELGLEFNVQVC
jgi:hypothetical protein